MKIEVTCGDDKAFSMKVEVYALSFDPNGKTFSMPLCVGDDWLQRLTCPLVAAPHTLHFQWNSVGVQFNTRADAGAFCDWLVEAEAKAQQGYRTMRG